MKTIGVSIAIGASVAGAINSIKIVQGSSTALSDKIDALNKRKLNIMANDTSVKKFTKKVPCFDLVDKQFMDLSVEQRVAFSLEHFC